MNIVVITLNSQLDLQCRSSIFKISNDSNLCSWLSCFYNSNNCSDTFSKKTNEFGKEKINPMIKSSEFCCPNGCEIVQEMAQKESRKYGCMLWARTLLESLGQRLLQEFCYLTRINRIDKWKVCSYFINTFW